MPEKLPITVAMIARNEAHNLPRCLDSVADWVSEIVLVLNEDCDEATEQVARRYGARTARHPWHGHRDQKNIALRYATQPWVLCLDADEEISAGLATEIQDFVRTDSPRWNGASFPRKVWFLGRWITHGDWYPDRSLRLFRRGKGQWGGSPEHDKLLLEGVACRLRHDMHHYSNPTLNSQIAKINYFADIFLQRQLEAGCRWSLGHVLLRPPWRFLRAYVLRLGFLDGFPGLYAAVLTAFATFVRHSRLYEHERAAQRPPHEKPAR